MKNFTNALRKAVNEQNWYAALTLALTLPDICGKIDDPSAKSGPRFARWFDRWMGKNYTHEMGPDREIHVFLSGDDCYALRCSLLHEGIDETGHQQASKSLAKFRFTAPTPIGVIHCNQVNNLLQLQVDIFGNEMADAVDSWALEVVKDPGKVAAINSLLSIQGTNADGKVEIRF